MWDIQSRAGSVLAGQARRLNSGMRLAAGGRVGVGTAPRGLLRAEARRLNELRCLWAAEIQHPILSPQSLTIHHPSPDTSRKPLTTNH